jgi:hypothetical protein
MEVIFVGENFKEKMNEKRPLNRWEVFKIGLFGAFCGALLTIAFCLIALA